MSRAVTSEPLASFGLSGNESNSSEVDEVHSYQEPRVITPEEEAALSRAVTSEPLAGGNNSGSVDRPFVSAEVSASAEEDQEQFQGE